MVLAAAGGLSTRPTKIEIRSPDGDTVAGVDENGGCFDPITTNHLDITVTETAPLTLHNPVAGADLQLPVGLTEVYLPALAEYRTTQAVETQEFLARLREGADARGRREAVRDEREGHRGGSHRTAADPADAVPRGFL